jgi:hypothetical protein
MEALDTMMGRLLMMDEGILSVAFVNFKGQTLVSKSKYSVKTGFTSDNVYSDCGIWLRGALALLEQCSKTLGDISTFVSFYEKGKLVAIRQNEIGGLIVLLLLPSTSIEYLISKINIFVTSYKELISSESIYSQYNITASKDNNLATNQSTSGI